MKWFWSLIILGAIATGVILIGRGTGDDRPQSADSGMSQDPTAAPVSPRNTPAPEAETLAPTAKSSVSNPASSPAAPVAEESAPVETAKPAVSAAASPTPETQPATPTPAVPTSPQPPTAPPATTQATPPAGAQPKTEPGAKATQEFTDNLNKVLGLWEDQPSAAPESTHQPTESGGSSAPSTASAPPSSAAAAGGAPAKAKLIEQPDGSVLVDDKYVVKGHGTQADPFIITWELLTSAQETYQPRLGRKVIPDRLQMISGKWVRISGYIAFPLMASSQDEMLVMLNQWDGCCIGIPPTPYDAVEVKLKKVVTGDDRLRVSGTLTGILRVDPYLIKDWLVSLYLMDDAALTVDSGAATRDPAASPQHKGGGGSPEP